MASWRDYQSVIQLAAGLNFAYASLEVILGRPLLEISATHQKLIDDLRTAARSGLPPRAGLSAVDYIKLRDKLDVVTWLHHWICRLNPYVSAACGFTATFLLFKATESGDEPIGSGDKYLIAGSGFIWFGTVLVVMASLRLLLNLMIAPALKRL